MLAAKEKIPSCNPSHPEVSSDSNTSTSFDISGMINFQKDIDEIKIGIRDLATKDDLDNKTKDLLKSSVMEETGNWYCQETVL